MTTNLDRFKMDLASLVERGEQLLNAMYYRGHKAEFEKEMKKAHGDKAPEKIKELPNFNVQYQQWYSESLALLRPRISLSP